MIVARRKFGVLAIAMMLLGSNSLSFAQNPPRDLLAAGGSAALVEKAKAEGTLLVYGTPVIDLFTQWVKRFETKYGIPVQYYRAPTNTVYQRFAQEQRAGRNLADILVVSDLRVVQEGARAGYLTYYKPETGNKFPDQTFIEGITYPLFTALSSVGWNTRVVPKDLQDALSNDPLQALLDPRLKDKIVVVDVTAGGAQLATYANLVLNQSEKYGWAYLEKIAKQNPTVVRTGQLANDGVISGDYWAALESYDNVFATAALKGAPVAYRLPDPAGAAVFYSSVANNAPHPYAARLFAEWSTSVEALNELAVVMGAEVLVQGWEDRRKVRELPWFRPPGKIYTAWQTDERLQGDNLKAFYRRWSDTFGQR